MICVLDASVAVAAARPNEPSHLASRSLLKRVLSGEDQILVPAIFPIEVGASLARVGEGTAATRAYVDALMAVAVATVSFGPRRARQIRDLAIEARLRAADAIYVWLASHEAVPLCTLDNELARRGGVYCRIVAP